MFQSSPGPRGPGVIAYKANCREWELVSILARPSRAGRRTIYAARTEINTFQSSPGPRGPGVKFVPEAWAGCALFQSSPGPRGPGVKFVPEAWAGCALFQSSPGPRGPGVTAMAPMWWSAKCFNPRPALAGRASTSKSTCDKLPDVSILARPSRAGRRLLPSSFWWQHHVSILARPSRAGRQGFAGTDGVLIRFQSSPGPRGPGVPARSSSVT